MIYVPSSGRATRVLVDFPDMTLVVPHKQQKEYRTHNTQPIIPYPDKCTDIGMVRQWIIDNAASDTVVMCDDDIKLSQRLPNKRLVEMKDPAIVAPILREAIDFYGYGMASIGMRAFNHVKPDVTTWSHSTAFFAIDRVKLRRHNIRIPRECVVLEDLYLSLALARHGYPNAIFNTMVHNNGTGGEAGGCSVYRNAEVQNRAAEFMAAQFPGIVVLKKEESKSLHFTRVYWARAKKQFSKD